MKGLTNQEAVRICSASSELTQHLSSAFSQAGIPERNRYILMLRAFAEFMRELDCPNEWQRKTWELGLANAQLDEGITAEILRPASRTDGGRPGDEWQVWIVRSRAVLALEARIRAEMSHGDAAKELKKRFPTLDAEPYAKRGQLTTSLRNWQRKMGEVKRDDHLGLVAERHEEARVTLADMPPSDAVAVADQLLENALR